MSALMTGVILDEQLSTFLLNFYFNDERQTSASLNQNLSQIMNLKRWNEFKLFLYV